MADPQVRHLGLVVPVEARSDGGTSPCARPFSSTADARTVAAAPMLNQHGEAIRLALAASKDWPAAKWPLVAGAAAG